MSKPISETWFHRIKAATRDLTDLCGGVERSGEIAHVSKTEVSRWRVATESSVISIPAALALETECGVPLVTTVMAELNGRRLSDGEGEGGSAAAVALQQAEFLRAASQVMAQGAVALADGKVTGAEADIWDRSAAEAQRGLAELRLGLAAVKAGEGGDAVGLKVVR